MHVAGFQGYKYLIWTSFWREVEVARIRLRMQNGIASHIIKYKSGPLRTHSIPAFLASRKFTSAAYTQKQDHTKAKDKRARNKKLEQMKGNSVFAT